MQTVSRKTSTTLTSGKWDLTSVGSMGVIQKMGDGMSEMELFLIGFGGMRMGFTSKA